MKEIYKQYLFGAHMLVNETGLDPHAFETAFSLANLFGIRLKSGAELAEAEMIRFAGEQLGVDVPDPFYRTFPAGVRALSPDQLLFDQLVHYTMTYGFGDFSRPGHSLWETDFERLAFKENAEIRDFSVVTEAEAAQRIDEAVKGFCAATRPLDAQKFALVSQYIADKGKEGLSFASQDLQIRLLMATRDMDFAKGLHLNDILKLTERMWFEVYGKDNPKKLNLKNKDRKFLARLIKDRLAASSDFIDCYERQARWTGLLHHIHFKAETEKEQIFCQAMRSGKNHSVWSGYEKQLAAGDANAAAAYLGKEKGSGAVIRQMNTLLSRGADAEALLPYLKRCGSVLLIQLLMKYAAGPDDGARSFTFLRFGLLRSHQETEEEKSRRRTRIPEQIRSHLAACIRNELERRYKGRLGKVYIDEAMKKIALPVSESSSQGGFGVLPKGSRIPLPEGKKIRAFTYWEKVDDVDLSVIGLDAEDRQIEFSWRTMAGEQSDAITYSGDETSGYQGGSEFFDIEMEAFRSRYPSVKYMIFCDNVFTYGMRFADCVCRAGYMMRDKEDSGEIFEPKTVSSSYTVNCLSSFAYLFGFDLERNEFVWLNSAVHSREQVAGETDLALLKPLFAAADTLNVYDLFHMLAAEITEKPEEAEIVVSDQDVKLQAGAEQIHSWDTDRLLQLMESR